MPRHLLSFIVTLRDPTRLDEFLLRALPAELERIGDGVEISKSKIRRCIVAGAVRVRGRQERNAANTLARGDRVTLSLDTEKFTHEKKPDDITFEMTADRVLYEDDSLIAVDKPAGIPTDATIVQARDYLQAAVVRFLSLRGDANPYVGLHHRLDKETSGVVLFTKRREANPAVHAMFQDHVAQKRYHALVERPRALPKKSFYVENEIGRVSPRSAAAKWGAVTSGGQRAKTDFLILEERRKGLLILAMPQTGRTHQIRVHLAGLGLPILGDTLYGGLAASEKIPCARVMLHASSLTFPHPDDGRTITVESPLPPDFLDCLRAL